MKNKAFLSQMLGCFQDRLDVFIILRFEQNSSLDQLLLQFKKFAMNYTRTVTTDMLLGLKYLHQQNIVHGDLKPANVLIDLNYRAHLSDFGLARNYIENPWHLGNRNISKPRADYVECRL